MKPINNSNTASSKTPSMAPRGIYISRRERWWAPAGSGPERTGRPAGHDKRLWRGTTRAATSAAEDIDLAGNGVREPAPGADAEPGRQPGRARPGRVPVSRAAYLVLRFPPTTLTALPIHRFVPRENSNLRHFPDTRHFRFLVDNRHKLPGLHLLAFSPKPCIVAP